jgi:hypothetical protein
MRANVDKTKEKPRDAAYAKGGRTRMFGPQAAGKAKPGTTSTDEGPAPGAKFARSERKPPAGGFSRRAAGGHTGPCDED